MTCADKYPRSQIWPCTVRQYVVKCLTLSHQHTRSTQSQQTTFENIVAKGEIAHQQFYPWPQYFQLYFTIKLSFMQICFQSRLVPGYAIRPFTIRVIITLSLKKCVFLFNTKSIICELTVESQDKLYGCACRNVPTRVATDLNLIYHKT